MGISFSLSTRLWIMWWGGEGGWDCKPAKGHRDVNSDSRLELQLKLNEMSQEAAHPCHCQPGHLTLFWLNEAGSSVLAVDPWIPGSRVLGSLFLYCLLAAHLRTKCVNALCGVNCLLPHLSHSHTHRPPAHLANQCSTCEPACQPPHFHPFFTASLPLPQHCLHSFVTPSSSLRHPFEPFKPPPCVDKLCA